jgi:hypothetical protein
MRELTDKFRRKFRDVYYNLSVFFQPEEKPEKNAIRIDVVIPAIEKNLPTLLQCIQGIRNCVTHRITNIYIVAPQNELFLQWCEQQGVILVDEVSVLGYTAESIDFITAGGRNRSGWIFQQLLKLSGNIGTERYFLVCDADHILVKPHCFVTGTEQFIFYQSKEYHWPYYVATEKLTGRQKTSCLSYVGHKMIFDKEMLDKLKHRIEERHREPWDKAICKILDRNAISPFSEYELYGHFVPSGKKIERPWQNKNLPNREIVSYPDLCAMYSKKYKAVTFPGYKHYLS